MCGFNGILQIKSQTDMNAKIIAMNNLIKHRGKDDGGYLIIDDSNQSLEYSDLNSPEELLKTSKNIIPFNELKKNKTGIIALSHKRLSIRDLSTNGHQPMLNDNKSLSMVYNGEVYNTDELKKELMDSGYQFKSKTDTEVILKAYEQWGAKSFNRLNGMFAFAIHDKKENKTILCRDRYGIKPLYYAKTKEAIIFSSELKPIHHIIKAKPDHQTIYDYLYLKQQNLRTDNTFFKEIKKIPCGSYAIIDQDLNIIINKWYDINETISAQPIVPAAEAEEAFKNLLIDSVKLRLIADVPVGTALSGGLDSSAIVASIHKLLPNPENINTFSSIFDEPEANEQPFIKSLIDKLNVKNKSITPTPEMLMEDIDDLIYCQEEPFLSLGMYAQYCVMRLASKDVKVTLDGQGGDEILAGYHRFFPALWLDQLKGFNIAGFINSFTGYAKEYSLNTACSWTIMMNRKNIARYQKFKKFDRFLQPNLVKNGNPILPKSMNAKNHLQQSMLDSLFHFGLPAYLHHADRNSMRFNIESRIPFLDHRLVEFSLGLPKSLLLQPAETKSILRKAFSDILPEKIIKRKDKMGFPTPQQRWQLKEPMKHLFTETLNSEWLFSEIINKKTFETHQQSYFDKKNNDWQTVWQVFCLQKWHQIFFEDFNYFREETYNEKIMA
ncbi:MAG: asparagine synthase (glutamine-hydrolyzing) [Planctomycetota bacterium]|nr:MAG: asparagine synthase (glutamine-hydrolyzing) [Planctomycetota bacterium]